MKFLTVFTIISSLLLLSCEKNNDLLYVDPNYPTSIMKLENETYIQLLDEYHSTNKFVETSINEFGFCDLSENNMNTDTPSGTHPASAEEVLNIVKEFLFRNRQFTGVTNPQLISIRSIRDLENRWVVHLNNQKLDTIEVYDTRIGIFVKKSAVTYCVGNQYPNIYFPEIMNFDQETAKNSLVGKKVTHTTLAGVRYTVEIEKTDLDKCEIAMVVCPIKKPDRIELRVAWRIYIPSVDYILSIDVMDGRIIRSEPTIIS